MATMGNYFGGKKWNPSNTIKYSIWRGVWNFKRLLAAATNDYFEIKRLIPFMITLDEINYNVT